MDFLEHLNPEQQAAVLHIHGPLLILAGAGSGKTRVISHRTAHLIGNGHAGLDEVLAVTFTNKAAEEMRERISLLLGIDCSRLWVSTFHSFCARLLRREGPTIGLDRNFAIYDSTDQLSVVRQAIRSMNSDEDLLQPRMVLSRISQAKNRMQGPDDLKDEGWSSHHNQIADIYKRYIQTLEENRALDFDDLLLKAVQLFKKSKRTLTRYAKQLRFIMVDEYQDTNRPQYLLIHQLADLHRNLCVVGDPDQSIYKWRGADLRNIMDFEQDFPEAKIVRLERNYRSTQIILDTATAVITRNHDHQKRRLWTERVGGTKVECCRAIDELSEATFITTRLRKALSENVGPMAVLYRTNAQSRALEDALLRDGLSYKILGNVRFYERKEVKDALAYLRLILNSSDDVSLRRVINVPPRGIGKMVIEALTNIQASTPPKPLWTCLTEAIDERLVPTRMLTSLSTFRDLIVNLSEVANRESVATTIGKVLDQVGYLQKLHDERSEEAESRMANLMELVSAARDYEFQETEASLVGFVDRLSLLSDVDKEHGPENAQISLMTLHTAKGLEFALVIMAGLEEGLFPHVRSLDGTEQIEEERRLCYVGMTRAQAQLVLTSAARRRVFGEYQSTEPSRFLTEIPNKLVDHIEQGFNTPFYGSSSESEFHIDPYTRKGRRRDVRNEKFEQPYAYEEEDQPLVSLRPGMRVRHPQFGLGTILSTEMHSKDVKLVVRFANVGQKKLLARYARLELV